MTNMANLLDQALDLYVTKGEDYGNQSPHRQAYFPYGPLSYMQMIHTKYTRAMHLVSNDQKPNFESLRDTLMDLLIYSALFILYLDNQRSSNADSQ